MRRPNARPHPPDPSPPAPMASPKSRLSRPPPPSPNASKRPILTLLSATAIAAVTYLFLYSKTSSFPKFSIIIDGGSTGSRIHVFGYRLGRGSTPVVVDFELSASMKVSPGLSAYAGDPDGAGGSIVELLEFAKGRVAEEWWGETEVRLMATAGMRLVEEGVRGRILESCRRVLRGSGFVFKDDWATVISGSDEGIYAWVAANYALGTLGGDPQKTIGIVELGGASAQITFATSEPLPPEFSHMLKFGEFTYNLYSHSFLHLGQNVAYESLRELLSSRDLKSSAEIVHEAKLRDPCTPKGYLHGVESLKLSAASVNLKTGHHPTAHAVGNFSECRSAALMLLQKEKDKCMYSSCRLGSTFIPKLQGRFIATENFFYTSKFFGLGPTSFLSDLMLAGEQFCGEDWLKLKKKYHTVEEEDLLQYCFSSAYIVALLHDSLGIAIDDERIGFGNQVGDIPLDWALGAFIILKTSNQEFEHSNWISAIISGDSNWISAIISGDSSALLCLFVVLVVVFTAWSVSRWRKPRLKTIYDLEKGRYILKRINR